MATSEPTPTQETNDSKADIRTGYEVAALLWTYQGTRIWNRFYVLLITHSLLLVAISQLLSGKRAETWAPVWLCGVGTFIGVLSLVASPRSATFFSLLGTIVRSLEERLDGVEVMSQHHRLVGGSDVSVEFRGGPETVRASMKSLRIRRLPDVISLTFIATYVFFIVMILQR